MNINEEIWKDIIGYEGFYQVSNLGRIKSLPRITARDERTIKILTGRILRLNRDERGGYLKVSLSKVGKTKKVNVHRIVALSFLENPNNLPQVNHINAIKIDNRVEDLEWVSRSDNSKHAYRMGLMSHFSIFCTEKHYSKIRREDILKIRELYSERHKTQREIAIEFGLSQSQISAITTRRSWKNI